MAPSAGLDLKTWNGRNVTAAELELIERRETNQLRCPCPPTELSLCREGVVLGLVDVVYLVALSSGYIAQELRAGAGASWL
jgi:hypothetical protein